MCMHILLPFSVLIAAIRTPTVKIVALAFGTAHTFFMSTSATDNLVLT